MKRIFFILSILYSPPLLYFHKQAEGSKDATPIRFLGIRLAYNFSL